FKMPEMRDFNNVPEDDSSSSNSSEYPCPKKVPLDGQYPDFDAECQNFLPEHTGKKKYATESHQGSASFGMSVFNLGNAIMGSGILGLSFAMANTGIALFVILLASVAIFSLYSVHLLLKTANEGGALVYEQLGYKAFGTPGKFAASLSITMQNIGGKKNECYLKHCSSARGETLVDGNQLVFVGIILPLSLLKNLGYLGYTSGLSLLCMVFFLIVVSMTHLSSFLMLAYHRISFTHILWPVLVLPIEFQSSSEIPSSYTTERDSFVLKNDTCKPKYFIVNSQTVYAVPIITFAFVCHPAILPMYDELKDRSRKKMQNVANVSFLAMFIMYLLAALFGYLTFNQHVGDELLHTYTKVYKFDVLLLIVRLAVLTAVTLTVPVVLFPIRTTVNHLLCPSKEFSWVRHTAITVFLLAGTNALVIFVPTIRDIFGFIGASAAAMLIFILPSAFYIRLVKKESMKSRQKIGALVFLVLGIVVMLGSMTLIILDWIKNATSDSGH
uniref:Sodium-coupled neutral amino acid symporter 2 n=1 Tax=Astatotilapia calliptera TaxID=8154 RepID=A0AAX7V0L7_ASTCA